MNIDTTQGPVRIDIPTNFKKIGLRLSGGADSALVAYMLSELPLLAVVHLTLCSLD